MDKSEIINTEVKETPETSAASVPPEPKKWLKIVLLGMVGLALVGGLVYAGYKFSQKGAPTEAPQPTPTPFFAVTSTPTPTQTVEDEAKDWQTYTNTKYGFEVKYPQLWKLEEKTATFTDDVIEVASLETDVPLSLVGVAGPKTVNYRVELAVVPNPKNKNFRDLVFSSFGFINEEINFREGRIGDYRVFETTDFPSGDGRLDVFLEVGGGLSYVHFRLYPYSDPYGDYPYENQARMISIFDQILSTFKFLE